MPALKRFITAAVLVGLVGVVDIAAPTTAQAVTVVNVDTTNDIVDGNPATTSLREAIDSANGDSQATEIVLGVGMTYQLTLCGPNDDTNAAGDLDHHGGVGPVGRRFEEVLTEQTGRVGHGADFLGRLA